MMQWIQELSKNEIFGGLFGASVFGFVLYALRETPLKLFEWLKWRFVATVTVHNDDPAFDRAAEWLATLDSSKRNRHLRLTTAYIDGESERALMTPDAGTHLLRTKLGWVMLKRVIEKSDTSFFKRETLEFSQLGGAPVVRALVAELMEERHKRGRTPVFMFRGHWRRVAQKPQRPVDSVILPAKQKARIVDDLRLFLARRSWYEVRSLPYRRGYLLEGPPGTGKTSLAMAMAGEVSRALYALNLGSLASDDALFEAVLTVPEDAILLIEDIDATNATKARETEVTPTAGSEPKKDERQLTLSGLLNALDGTCTREGRIVIMTTNHPEKLDPALLRPGRADVREHLGLFGSGEARLLVDRFGADLTLVDELAAAGRLPIAPAELQGILLRGDAGA